jgi:hypothetical protein
MTSRPIVFDRSRRETDDRCARARFWAYEFNGTGLESVRKDVALETGTYVHKGLDLLGQGMGIDEAVAQVLADYRAKATLSLVGEVTPQERVVAEQAALIEAQLRAWAIVRLPKLNAEYELVESEQEYCYRFPTGEILMMRLDRLERRRSDGKLVIRDFKTVGDAGDGWRRAFNHNQQVMTLALPVEQKYQEEIAGVIIEGLVKGKRNEYPKGSGLRQQNSPLIYAWKRSGKPAAPPFDDAGPDEWFARYEWHCSEPHKQGNGRNCPGDKDHKLSGVFKAPVWESYPGGVKAWVEFLAATDLALLEEQFIELPPVLRSEYELREWEEYALYRERTIAAYRAEVEADPSRLTVLFPKQTNGGYNCAYCPFTELCWGIHGTDPLGSGLFVSRVPNHPQEFKLKEELVNA